MPRAGDPARARRSRATNGLALRVRCGLHLGEVERRDGDYFGGAVNRAARIMGAAHGGQILLSRSDGRQHVRQAAAAVEFAARSRHACGSRIWRCPERVYQLVHPQLRQDFPALRSLETTPNNLPQQISSFVGRERETARGQAAAWREAGCSRWSGVGGIGKTRLALQAAADTHDAYPDGVWFVELGSIADPLLVPSSVAQVLGVRERAGTELDADARAIISRPGAFAGARQLRALDRRPAPRSPASLLQAAPEIRILASSREHLQVAGEQIYAVPPLSLPAPDADLESLAASEAVQMFVERIRLLEPALCRHRAPGGGDHVDLQLN